MINTFLQLLHGRIIPFQAVVNTFDHHLQPSQVNGQLLPVTSVLNHYIKIPNKIDENPCGVGFDLPNHCGASKWRGFLCSEGRFDNFNNKTIMFALSIREKCDKVMGNNVKVKKNPMVQGRFDNFK